MTDKLTIDQRGSVLIIRLSDPAMRNAITREMRLELESAMDGFIGSATARCLLLTGSEGFFCVGGDVRSFTDAPTSVSNRTRLTHSHRLLKKMLKVEKPVVVAVNGAAVGAGFGLAMLGDIVVASESAFFQPAFPAVGLAPDYGLGKTLARAVGDKRAKDILMTNARVTAADALRIGMISRLHSNEELFDKALEIADSLGNGPTVAHGLAKTLMENASQSSIDDFFDLEAACQAIAMGSEDHREGVQAFLQKRKASFKGA